MSGRVECVCAGCGARFSRWPSQVGTYCSRSCKGRAAGVLDLRPANLEVLGSQSEHLKLHWRERRGGA